MYLSHSNRKGFILLVFGCKKYKTIALKPFFLYVYIQPPASRCTSAVYQPYHYSSPLPCTSLPYIYSTIIPGSILHIALQSSLYKLCHYSRLLGSPVFKTPGDHCFGSTGGNFLLLGFAVVPLQLASWLLL